MSEKETSSMPENKSWFSEITWKAGLIVAAIGFISGGTGGGIAAKNSHTEGLSQDAADVRYLTKEEAEKRSDKRDKQLDRIEQKITDAQTKFENEQKEQMKILLKILENQKNAAND